VHLTTIPAFVEQLPRELPPNRNGLFIREVFLSAHRPQRGAGAVSSVPLVIDKVRCDSAFNQDSTDLQLGKISANVAQPTATAHPTHSAVFALSRKRGRKGRGQCALTLSRRGGSQPSASSEVCARGALAWSLIKDHATTGLYGRNVRSEVMTTRVRQHKNGIGAWIARLTIGSDVALVLAALTAAVMKDVADRAARGIPSGIDGHETDCPLPQRWVRAMTVLGEVSCRVLDIHTLLCQPSKF